MNRNPLSRTRHGRHGATVVNVVLGLVGVLIIGALAAYTLSGRGPNIVDAPLTKAVHRGPFEHVVAEQGEVESSSNVELRCEVKSRGTSGITILEVVPEGTMVSQGDMLVRLDSTALDQENIQQQIACNNAEATAIQSMNTFEAAKIAKIEYLEGTFKQTEQTALSAVFVAEQNLRTAKLAFASAERLSLRGLVNPLQLEAEQFNVDKARKELEAAQTALDVLVKYTKEKTLKQLDSDITSAEAKWKADQKSLELEHAKLKDIEDQIAKCTIRAPRQGQVKYANKYNAGRSGSTAEFVVEAGSVVREQQPIIYLPDPGQMQVKATINESRINLVKRGMPVAVRVDALQSEMLTGEVVKVNQYAEPGGWTGGNIKKYAAFVRITNPPDTLRAGMNAEVRIFVEREPDALQVPVQALAEYKEKYFCLVDRGGKLITQAVERGGSNDKFMVVTSGLQENDLVVLNPRSRPELSLPELPDPVPVAKVERPSDVPREGAAITPVNAKSDAPKDDGPRGERPGGRFTPAMLVARVMEQFDANTNDRLEADEVAKAKSELPPERQAWTTDADGNRDGIIDRTELTLSMSKAMAQRRAAGGGPPDGGPGGGPPGGAGPGG